MRIRKGSSLLAMSLLIAAAGTGCGEKQVSFKQGVHPIFQKNCLTCHAPGGEGYEKSGFSVQSYETVMKGTRFGSVITPGSSLSSTLVILIEHKADLSINMPRPKVKRLLEHEKYLKEWKVPMLSAEEIKLIRAWIDQGAKNN